MLVLLSKLLSLTHSVSLYLRQGRTWGIWADIRFERIRGAALVTGIWQVVNLLMRLEASINYILKVLVFFDPLSSLPFIQNWFILSPLWRNKRAMALIDEPSGLGGRIWSFKLLLHCSSVCDVTILSCVSQNFKNRYTGLKRPWRSFLRPYLNSVTSNGL